MDINGEKAIVKNNGTKEIKSAKVVVREKIDQMIPELKKALPNIGITAERMARMTLTAMNNNPKLYECNIQSLMAAMVQSASLGLEPNSPLGQAYLIPYKDTVNFQIGYKGILELCYRTKQYKSIYAKEVYKNDVFEFEYGLEPKLRHKPAVKPEGDPIYYYAVYVLDNNGTGFEVMSKEQVDLHSKKYSQAVQKGWTSPWKTDFDSMALKTVLKKALRYAPKSSEVSKAIAVDETSGKFNDDMSDIVPEYNTEIIEQEPVNVTPETKVEQVPEKEF